MSPAVSKHATDEKLTQWAEYIHHLAFIAADEQDWDNIPPEGKPFPPYYNDDHYAYLLGLIDEVRRAWEAK